MPFPNQAATNSKTKKLKKKLNMQENINWCLKHQNK